MKLAILSMDIEDWYHLDYIDRSTAAVDYSMLDGLDVYTELLDRYGIRSSLFTLGELAGSLKRPLRELAASGHDIASHGWGHRRPLTLSRDEFLKDMQRSKHELEDLLGREVAGYRAPCFSMDRERLDAVRQVGYRYDSSLIACDAHPLYGAIDMSGYEQPAPGAFRSGEFFEFQVTTRAILGKEVPISGGGYLRIFPWLLMRSWIHGHLRSGEIYVLYIHPFELSSRSTPPLHRSVGWKQRLRFQIGRRHTAARLEMLIRLLGEHGYSFTTFADLRSRLLRDSASKRELAA